MAYRPQGFRIGKLTEFRFDNAGPLTADSWGIRAASAGPGPTINAPATLADIALVGFFSDGTTAGTDNFAFVILADLSGQTINFTDNGWLSTNAFRTGEGIVSYVVPAGTAIGTVVTLPGGGNFNLSTGGDQIIAYTGTLAAPTAILFALDFANTLGWDATAADTNTSAVPQGLTAGTTALSFATDNGAYTGSLTGTRAQILANIANAANWTTNDTAAVAYPGNFTVTGAGTLAIDNVILAEGDAGTTAFTFTVTRSGGSSGAVGATWTLVAPGGAGNADAGDFDGAQLSTGTVSFADGDTSETITILVQGDLVVEGSEAFTIVLSAPTGGVTIADDTGDGTITNDDIAPVPGELSIDDVSVAEGNSGTTPITFTVTRANGDDGAVGATWTVTFGGGAGDADSGDFEAGETFTGTVAFADGVTTQTITLDVQGDTGFEPDEDFTVTLSAPTGGATISDATGTGTITNDDPAPAGTLDIDDVSHSEGDNGTTTTYTFTVTRSAGSAGAVGADYTISAPGGAGNASTDDFVAGAIFSGQIAFADGETSQTISIDVEGDVAFEPDEIFTVTLTNPTGGAGIGDGSGTGTIVNDDLQPPAGSVSIADVSIVEGNAGTSILTVTLTRIAGTAAFDVNYATSNGGNPNNASATAGSDYVAASGTVSFAESQNIATISITINGDVTPELDEEFTVTLSNPTNGATISDPTAVATIETDDVASSTINIWTENFDAFLGGGFSPTPTVGQLDSDIYITSGFDDPANPSVNYGGTVTTGDLARGVTSVAVTTGGIYSLDRGSGNHAFLVQPGGTDFTPGDFTMRLVNTSGLAADTFAVAYDILVRNDQARGNSFNLSYSTDGVNFFALSAFNYTSPDAADALGVVTVARSGQFTTASSVAAGGFLYLRLTGDDVSGSGSRDEFGLDNVTVGVAGGSATPTVSVSDVSVSESAGTMTFTITRTNLVGGAFTVDYATADGSATAGDDYVATSGTLSFTDNQVQAVVTVTINDDGTPELDETVLLNLTNATSGATIADAQGVGTIVNDDGTPIQVSINDVSIVEGNAGTSMLTFTVTRTGGTGAFDVNFATANGTAVEPGDYLANSGTLSFGVGQISQTISVTINGDLTPESNETFQVLLSGATNNAIITDSSGTGTIINDEATFIHDIQGTAYYSPILAGDGISGFNIASTTIVTVRAIVTAVDNVGTRQGYYLAEEITDWDGNSFTSEGIFVMTRNDAGVGTVVSGVSVGDLVQLSANVMEYQAFSTMPRTVLVNATPASVISSGNSLPTVTLTNMPNEVMTGVTPDYTDSADGVGDSFDASVYALSYFETVEGMLVTIPNMVVADGFVSTSGGDPFLQAYSLDSANPDQINSRGGYTIAGDPPIGPPDTPETGDDTNNGGRVLHDGDVNPDIIELDFTDFAAPPPAGLTQNATMGDQLGDVTGIIDFDFTDRKLFVTAMEPGGFVNGGVPVRETTALGNDGRSLTVATFNVENLDPGDGAARFTALANAIANNLNAPDIISIEEMQDNNGATASGGADASTTWQMLVNALNLATGANYQWVDQEPVAGAEGGEPGGNIRVGFLYNTDRVQLGDLAANATLAERRQYTDRIGDGVRDAGDLIAYSDNMLGGEINTADWTTTRRSLLGEFTFNGNIVYVTANHWPAKGGSGDFWQFNQNLGTGDPDNSDWAQRNQVAQDVYAMLDLIQTGSPDAGIVAGGDFNDFYFYRPLTTVTGHTLADGTARVGGSRLDNLTITELTEAERYTYTFDGRSQAIDHIIVNAMLSGVASYDVVHINTGYNGSGTGPDADPSLSDHDPALASFDFREFDEVLTGTGGNDVIGGFGGDDEIRSLGGDDVLIGGAGADLVAGGAGDDTYYVDDSGDVVEEQSGEGRDIVYARVSYALTAGAEVEILSTGALGATDALDLTGNEFAQEIIGNDGANILFGGGGADAMTGLGGDDQYRVTDGTERVFETGGDGRDVVYAVVDYALTPGSEVEVLSAVSIGATTPLQLTGNEFGQQILGNNGNNVLRGGGGADALVGYDGDDVYYVTDGGETIHEAAGGGRDVVYAGVDYTLRDGAEVEVLAAVSQSGTDAIDLTGNAGANVLLGNAGDNVLNGGLGADTLVGFGGADAFAFTSSLGGGNVDFILDFASGTDTIRLHGGVFAGLGFGTLADSAFALGSAQDADDRIVYDQGSGALYYDADGSGNGAAVQFATVNAGTIVVASDFTVI